MKSICWILALLTAVGTLGAQPAPKSEAALRMLRENPNRAGVNTHIYEFREEKNTPPPSGFKYVYLAHYARHGARNDWRPQHYTYVIDILEKADSAGLLNGEGRYLLEKTRGVLEEHGGMDGHLTRRGEFEHREIARRLYSRYKPVFRHGSKYVRVESTTVPRTLVSMACCVSELSKLQKDLDFTIDTGEKYMEMLNNGASAEHKKASMVLLDSLRLNTPSDNETIFRTLFTDPEKAREYVKDPEKFQKYIFYTARISESAGVASDLWRVLPEDVIYRWWDWFNRELYIRQGNSVEFGYERMKRTEPLVEEIVSHADQALSDGSVAADLYFGHDYPVMALAGYFALEGPGDRMRFDEIPYRYCDPRYVMLGMNIQWVFCRSKKGETLCKIVYNGEERRIRGLNPVSGPWYRWTDIKNMLSLQER